MTIFFVSVAVKSPKLWVEIGNKIAFTAIGKAFFAESFTKHLPKRAFLLVHFLWAYKENERK